MNAPHIIKSFQYFYENILPKALTSPDFTEEGIANAFLWAEFCEKLYGRLDEENLKKIRVHFGTHSAKWHGDENSKQCITALCHAFLQNPNIERSFLKNVLSRIQLNGFSLSEIWEDAIEFNELCFNLIESLKPISLRESDRSLYYEVKSELFVDFLKDFTNQLVTEGQAEILCNFLFETLCDGEDSMEVLLNILTWDDSQVSHIQTLAIHWVLLKLMDDPECQIAHSIWRQPPSRLRAIAASHPAFCSCYLEFLTKCTSSGSGDCRAPFKMAAREVSFTHSEVLKHFKVLTSCHDDVARNTLVHLGKLAQNDAQNAVWKDILTSVT